METFVNTLSFYLYVIFFFYFFNRFTDLQLCLFIFFRYLSKWKQLFLFKYLIQLKYIWFNSMIGSMLGIIHGIFLFSFLKLKLHCMVILNYLLAVLYTLFINLSILTHVNDYPGCFGYGCVALLRIFTSNNMKHWFVDRFHLIL